MSIFKQVCLFGCLSVELLAGWAVGAAELMTGERAQTQQLAVFPASTYTAAARGNFIYSDTFTPSVGPWMAGLEERGVFQAALRHELDAARSYELRVGKGGQIYSLAGAFGESVPPSFRRDGPSSPWNDEVWQFVAVCERYNLPGGKVGRKKFPWLAPAHAKGYQATYFLHNSGCYIADAGASGLRSLYCPLLAKHFDRKKRVYQQLNWGLVPQQRTLHRSPILYYLQVRDAGGGVIELTWVAHNFSARADIVFDYLNAPWGGVRYSSLPHVYTAGKDGRLLSHAELQATRQKPGQPSSHGYWGTFDKVGGYMVASQSLAANSPALALVFGADKHYAKEQALKAAGRPYLQDKRSVYRSWLAGAPFYAAGKKFANFQELPPASFRNYWVQEVAPRFLLRPGMSIFYRSYLAVGPRAATSRLAASLVAEVDYGVLTFDRQNTPRQAVKAANGQTLFHAYSRPVSGALPIFILRRKGAARLRYTTDPHALYPQETLNLKPPPNSKYSAYFSQVVGHTIDDSVEFLGLAGFGLREKPADGNWRRLSTCVRQAPFKPPNEVDVWVQK